MRTFLLSLLMVLAPAGDAVGAQWFLQPDGSGDVATVQDAVQAAAEGDIIELADGTYTGPGNRDIDFLGKQVTVRSASDDPAACVIRCEGTSVDPHRGFLFRSGEGTGAVLRGVTVTGGHQTDVTSIGYGGAVAIDGGSTPVFQNCVFTANQSPRGGAVWIGQGSSAVFRDCTLSFNTSTGTGYTPAGGGLYASGAADLFECRIANNSGGALIILTGPSTLTHCVIQGNSGQGSTVSLDDATVRGCDFLDNRMIPSVFSGGGLYSSFSQLTLIGCRFAGNLSSRSGGGAYLVSCTATITDCTFETNTAGTRGGGLHLNQGTTAVVRDCLFRANHADGIGATNEGGGGVHVDFGSIATFDACTFVDNTAALKGGGLYLSGTLGGSSVLTRCTLSGNGAPTGGGVLVANATSTTRISNCIIAFGTEGEAMTCENAADPIVSCSDVFGNAGGDAVCGDDSVDNFSADPLFCFPEAGDYTLQWGSPCLPALSGGCGQVGRRGFGACNAVSLTPESWGQVKARYRR